VHHAFSPPAADSRTRSAEHRDLFPPGKPWPIPSGKKSSSRTQRLFQEAGSSTPWHDYQLPPIVKALLPFLCLLASLLPAASKEREHKAFDEAMSQQFSLGLGKSYTFFHLADRAKRLQENQWIQVTGQHHGLLLQIDKDAKIHPEEIGSPSCSSRWMPGASPDIGEHVSHAPIPWWTASMHIT